MGETKPLHDLKALGLPKALVQLVCVCESVCVCVCVCARGFRVCYQMCVCGVFARARSRLRAEEVS